MHAKKKLKKKKLVTEQHSEEQESFLPSLTYKKKLIVQIWQKDLGLVEKLHQTQSIRDTRDSYKHNYVADSKSSLVPLKQAPGQLYLKAVTSTKR